MPTRFFNVPQAFQFRRNVYILGESLTGKTTLILAAKKTFQLRQITLASIGKVWELKLPGLPAPQYMTNLGQPPLNPFLQSEENDSNNESGEFSSADNDDTIVGGGKFGLLPGINSESNSKVRKKQRRFIENAATSSTLLPKRKNTELLADHFTHFRDDKHLNLESEQQRASKPFIVYLSELSTATTEEIFSSLNMMVRLFSDALAFWFTFDVTRPETLSALVSYNSMVLRYPILKAVPKYILALKSDEDWKISWRRFSEIKKLIEPQFWFPISAKLNLFVEEPFYALSYYVYGQSYTPPTLPVHIQNKIHDIVPKIYKLTCRFPTCPYHQREFIVSIPTKVLKQHVQKDQPLNIVCPEILFEGIPTPTTTTTTTTTRQQSIASPTAQRSRLHSSSPSYNNSKGKLNALLPFHNTAKRLSQTQKRKKHANFNRKQNEDNRRQRQRQQDPGLTSNLLLPQNSASATLFDNDDNRNNPNLCHVRHVMSFKVHPNYHLTLIEATIRIVNSGKENSYAYIQPQYATEDGVWIEQQIN